MSSDARGDWELMVCRGPVLGGVRGSSVDHRGQGRASGNLGLDPQEHLRAVTRWGLCVEAERRQGLCELGRGVRKRERCVFQGGRDESGFGSSPL